MKGFENLRSFARGDLDAATLRESVLPASVTDDDVSEFEGDELFMQECQTMALGTIVQSMILGEEADQLDEATQNAISVLKDYFVGQGIIDEAQTVRITNQKINVVHLSKAAQIKRLTTIIILKMARKKNHKAYKKYKIGQKIKKTNLEIMRNLFGNKAAILAKKLWAKNRKSAKMNAVVRDAKK